MKKTIVCAAIALFAAAASAQQYKWTDKDGKVRYGDVPPAGASAARLKAPNAGYPPPAAAPDSKKEEAKKKAPEKQAMTEEQMQMKRDNCARAQESLRTLESGQRISRIDAKGERYYLEDAEIAQETAKARQSVQHWCT
jgi:hypothetical protein